jgi:hypothetical protein
MDEGQIIKNIGADQEESEKPVEQSVDQQAGQEPSKNFLAEFYRIIGDPYDKTLILKIQEIEDPELKAADAFFR